jgi:peptidoglycan/xylan/chitin deacetylase (PgdA/CDA1 family)
MKALPVLMYHHVSPAPGLVTLSPEIFRDQIATLAKAGWRSIGSAELENFLDGKPLPEKSVMLSFDDGYLDNFIHAHPVLREFGMKAVLFVVTGWIGDGSVRAAADCPDHRECKRRIAAGDTDSVMLRWSEIEQMRAAGTFEFHSHTHSHTRWDQSIADYAQRILALEADLLVSRQTLTARLGIDDRHLCWPQGYYQADYLPVANRLGFRYLYTTRLGTNPASAPVNEVRRIVVKEKGGEWLLRRLRIYASPLLTRIYSLLKGEK